MHSHEKPIIIILSVKLFEEVMEQKNGKKQGNYDEATDLCLK